MSNDQCPLSGRRIRGGFLAVFALLCSGPAWAAAAAPAPQPAVVDAPPKISPDDLQFFETKVRPILVDRCYKCHSKSADKVKGGLLLDTREGWMHGGNDGDVIVPGKPDDSMLIQAIRYDDKELQMPDDGKLSDQQIADLTEWVRRGAPDPRSLTAEGSSSKYGGVGKAHWAFQPVKKPAVPAVRNTAWVQTPVDNFILDKLEAAGLSPNAPADKRTLIRRVTYDLIGLPPTEAEVQAFLADNSPDAYAHVVDRLLASPQYGERWGRYWLDVARYADTKGDPKGQDDPRFPYAWTYRDYVIDAFNKDKPWTQFIMEQLAADRIIQLSKGKPGPQPNPSIQAALGFLTLGNTFDGNRNDVINDQIDVTTKGFLGMTVTCARCHDHKFDPIPTKDYYSLYGVFANTAFPPSIWAEPIVNPLVQTPELTAYLAKVDALKKEEADLTAEQQALRAARRGGPPPAAIKAAANPNAARGRAAGPQAAQRPAAGAAQAGMSDMGNSMNGMDAGASMAMAAAAPTALSANDIALRQKELQRNLGQFQKKIVDLEMTDPGAPPRANVLGDVPRPQNYPVLIRGEAQNKGDVVPRRFLEVLSPDPKNRPVWTNGSGRYELAQAIASPTNPLTARVLVNRLWQQHFGEGFVATPDDLGNMSSPPTHPELIDYLAARFMEEGWSVKKLQRLIVMSAVYRQAGDLNAAALEKDPDNKLHWRFSPRRLDFEQVHDALLLFAGTLDPKIGGPSVRIESAEFTTRRAVYAYIDRSNTAEILTQFDFPNPSVPSGRRYLTIVPQQSLFLMNGTLVIEAARRLTHDPEFAALPTDRERIESLYYSIFQRAPTAAEMDLCFRYIAANPDGTSLDTPRATPRTQAASRAAQQQVQQAARAAANPRGRSVFQAEPGAAAFTDRRPVDAWTKLAHALFQTNEAMFYN